MSHQFHNTEIGCTQKYGNTHRLPQHYTKTQLGFKALDKHTVTIIILANKTKFIADESGEDGSDGEHADDSDEEDRQSDRPDDETGGDKPAQDAPSEDELSTAGPLQDLLQRAHVDIGNGVITARITGTNPDSHTVFNLLYTIHQINLTDQANLPLPIENCS